MWTRYRSLQKRVKDIKRDAGDIRNTLQDGRWQRNFERPTEELFQAIK